MIELQNKITDLMKYYAQATIVIMIILINVNHKILSTSVLIEYLSYGIMCSTFLLFIFTHFLWKWKIFKCFVKKPYIGGKWTGTLYFNHKDIDSNKPISISIEQNYFSISLDIDTGDGNKSYAYQSGFCFTGDNHTNHLVYSYIKNSSAKEIITNPNHKGTASLSINNDATEMDGNYWTEMKSIGRINVRRNFR